MALRLALAAALPVALAAVGAWIAPTSARSHELLAWTGSAVATFRLQTAAGDELRLDSLRGRPVLVHFFATWCEPCKEELPALRRFVERAGPSLTVIAISVAEVDLRVQRFLEGTPVNFPVLLDRDRAVAKAWRVSTLPSTVIVDAQLRPRLVAETDIHWDTIEPRDLLARLTGSAPPTPPSSTGRMRP